MNHRFIPDQEIESQADEAREKAGIAAAPIDPVKVAIAHGIEVFGAEFDDSAVCGVLDVKGTKKAIYFNSSHPTTRQRFTISHEIGHCLLHSVEKKLVDSELMLFRIGTDSAESPSKNRIEIQANKFAAALLMPRKLVKEAFELTQDIALLASIFGVSRAAMGFRLNYLELGSSE